MESFTTPAVGRVVADCERYKPVVLAAEFALPVLAMFHATVSWPLGATNELLRTISCGTRFGCGRTVTTWKEGEGLASSARELWFSVLLAMSSAITHK